jgi:hypothetical protein
LLSNNFVTISKTTGKATNLVNFSEPSDSKELSMCKMDLLVPNTQMFGFYENVLWRGVAV